MSQLLGLSALDIGGEDSKDSGSGPESEVKNLRSDILISGVMTGRWKHWGLPHVPCEDWAKDFHQFPTLGQEEV